VWSRQGVKGLEESVTWTEMININAWDSDSWVWMTWKAGLISLSEASGFSGSYEHGAPFSWLVSIDRQGLLTWNTLTQSSPRKLCPSLLAASPTLWPAAPGLQVPSWDFPMHLRMMTSWTTRREVAVKPLRPSGNSRVYLQPLVRCNELDA
jgi:hypothetical protein